MTIYTCILSQYIISHIIFNIIYCMSCMELPYINLVAVIEMGVYVAGLYGSCRFDCGLRERVSFMGQNFSMQLAIQDPPDQKNSLLRP